MLHRTTKPLSHTAGSVNKYTVCGNQKIPTKRIDVLGFHLLSAIEPLARGNGGPGYESDCESDRKSRRSNSIGCLMCITNDGKTLNTTRGAR